MSDQRRAAPRDRCDECGHAKSSHNELGYCRATSKRYGCCLCGDWRAGSFESRQRSYWLMPSFVAPPLEGVGPTVAVDLKGHTA